MNQLVSVVITTYKRDIKYVKEAFFSVVNQTYTPIEIILVDDNGLESEYQDGLVELCNDYNNARYIQNHRNSGAQFSRNRGIMEAKGEYIAFLDDDDIWRKDKIEKQIELFQQENVGMVFCDGYAFEEDNISKTCIFREASIYDRPITHVLELFNDYVGSTSQAVIRKECLYEVGLFDSDMPARQDYEMWLRISKKYSIVGSQEKLLFYRLHNGDRISRNFEKCRNSYLIVLKKYKDDYNQNKYAKAKILLRASEMSLRLKDTKGVIKYLIFSFFSSPICIYDVIKRRITKKEFSEYYSIELLKRRGIR